MKDYQGIHVKSCECEGASPRQVAILSSQSSTTPWAVGVSSGAFNGDGSVTSASNAISIRIHPDPSGFSFGVVHLDNVYPEALKNSSLNTDLKVV